MTLDAEQSQIKPEPKILVKKKMLEIPYRPKGEILKIDEIWLRDHCQCSKCYNMETKQRIFNFLDVEEDVHPLEVLYEKDENLEIKWNDGHKSTYKLQFLYEGRFPKLIASSRHTLWNQEILTKHKLQLFVKLNNLVSKDETVRDFVSSLIRFGIGFIENVPANTNMTEMAIRRVFPIMNTFFGAMFTFSDRVQEHADTAYTNEYIGSHNDNTYFCDAAGLQILHCIEHKNGTGGENFFVDGFHVAEELKRRHPEAFKILTTVHVPAEFVEDGLHHTHSAPIIRLNPITGEVIQIRYNLYDRAVFNTIKQEEMKSFYDSLRKLTRIIEDPDNRWTIKLNPGTIVVFDNWRTLHARHSYTGQRTMTGCYVSRTDFTSKARSLGIIE